MSETNMYFDNDLKQWVIEQGGAVIAFGGSPGEVLQNYKHAMQETKGEN